MSDVLGRGCPNEPSCGHPGLLHDIYDLEDQHPMCCVEGCPCGKTPQPAVPTTPGGAT